MKKFLEQKDVDRHKGQTAFVLGAGPSLRKINPTWLRDCVVIAVNDAILKVPFAKFFMSCDWGMPLRKAWLTVKESECSLILHNVDVGFSYLDDQTGVKAFDGISLERVSYFDFKKDNELVMERKSRKLIRGSSSVHSAVHLAHLLGCSPIVLLGCDCQYEEEKYHFTDFVGQPMGGFIKSEYEKIKPQYSFVVTKFENTDAVLMGHVACWKKIREQNPNVPIINASEGRLKMFTQMSLEKVLE